MANILDKAELLALTDGIAFYATVGGVDYYILQSTLKAPLDTHIANTGNPHSVTKAQVGLGNADNTSDADKPISTAQAAVNTAQATTNGLKFDKADLSTETNLGTDATSLNIANRYKAFWRGSYTSNQTLTFSSQTNLREMFGQITNTNANLLTFAGISVHFNDDELPDGVGFSLNGSSQGVLTFPADTDVVYNLTGIKINGVFNCIIRKTSL